MKLPRQVSKRYVLSLDLKKYCPHCNSKVKSNSLGGKSNSDEYTIHIKDYKCLSCGLISTKDEIIDSVTQLREHKIEQILYGK